MATLRALGPEVWRVPGRVAPGVAGFLLLLCLLSEFHAFTWTWEIQSDRIRPSPYDNVYETDLSQAPFSTRWLGFGAGDRDSWSPSVVQRQSGFLLLEDDRELGPAHIPLKWLSAKGKASYSYRSRTLYWVSSDLSDPRLSAHIYSFRGPIVVNRFVSAFCLLFLLLSFPRRRDQLTPTLDSVRTQTHGMVPDGVSRFRDLVVVVLAVLVASVFVVDHPDLTIAYGPLVSGTGMNDARFWSDTGLALASGETYSAPFRPGYAYLLAGLYGLLGYHSLIPTLLNILAFAATALVVFRLTATRWGQTAGLAALLLFFLDRVRLDYLQVSNTDSVATTLYGAFVCACWVVQSKSISSKVYYLLLSGLLAFANLVKIVTLPAILPLAALAFLLEKP